MPPTSRPALPNCASAEHETFAAWRAQTPPGFLMEVKASRYLTHLKRSVSRRRRSSGCSSARPASARIGPVLYQLPPQLRIDSLGSTSSSGPRHGGSAVAGGCITSSSSGTQSCYTPDTFACWKRTTSHSASHDKRGAEIAEPAVGPFVYVRFHGTSGHYRGSYGSAALDRWAGRLADLWRAGRDVYAYFNNDPGAGATRNANSFVRSCFRGVRL